MRFGVQDPTELRVLRNQDLACPQNYREEFTG